MGKKRKGERKKEKKREIETAWEKRSMRRKWKCLPW